MCEVCVLAFLGKRGRGLGDGGDMGLRDWLVDEVEGEEGGEGEREREGGRERRMMYARHRSAISQLVHVIVSIVHMWESRCM